MVSSFRQTLLLIVRHCRGYLTIQRRRRAPAPPVADPAPANEGDQARDGEVEGEPAANDAQNQNDLQRPQVCIQKTDRML
jgi:hypothetical protein